MLSVEILAELFQPLHHQKIIEEGEQIMSFMPWIPVVIAILQVIKDNMED